MDSPALPTNFSRSLLNLTPPDISELSSLHTRDVDADLTDLSLSDLQPPKHDVPIPRPRFSLFARPPVAGDYNEADESSIADAADDEEEDEEEDEPASSSSSHRQPTSKSDQPSILKTNKHTEQPKQDDESNPPAPETTPRSKSRQLEPADEAEADEIPATVTRGPPPLTEEERLRRQLFGMQKINASFREYFNALSAVRDRQQVRLVKSQYTYHHTEMNLSYSEPSEEGRPN